MATNDAFLWYNVGDWAKYGLAVPNFGDDTHSQNGSVRYLTNTMGRNLQLIMFSPDARRPGPPTIKTLTRVRMLCERAREILDARAVPENVPSLEPTHALPAPESFKVYPVPYFTVPNPWLKQYCELVLLALTDAMQDTDNARPIEISQRFAGQVGQYIQRVYKLMSVELFSVPAAEASKPDFVLTDAVLSGYDPFKKITSTEALDRVPSLREWPTEDDMSVLTDGIAVTQLPVLGPWPSTYTGSGASTSTGTTPTVIGPSFASPPV